MTKKQFQKLAIATVATAALGGMSVAHAQSANTLIDKLVQKGILTVDEAKDLRTESTKEFNNAFSNKLGLPSWVEALKFSGDFRSRLDYLSSDNFLSSDRYRLRYRLRVGVVSQFNDDFEVGFRLGTGDASGGPLSNNTTFENNGSKKPIWVDTAYAKWTPIHTGDWTASTTIGKMTNPFEASAMLFDPDYTPEGGALQATYNISKNHTLKFNAGAFVLDELSNSSRDPFLMGAQAIWNAKWNSTLASSLGVSIYDIFNVDNLTTANVPDGNAGNSRDGANNLLNNYNPIVVSGSVTYTADNVPLYKGAFPIKLAGEFMKNPGASKNNEGYWGGVTFGKAGHKGQWEIGYRYQYLESDAWYEELVNDDNVGYYQAAFVGGKSGIVGGTNIKGHLVQVSYALTDALTFSFSGYFNDLIMANPTGSSSGVIHLMGDLMWKF